MTSVKPRAGRHGEHDDAMVVELMGALLITVRRVFPAEDWEGLRQSHFRMLALVPPDGITVSGLADQLSMTKQACGQFVTFLTGTGHLRIEQQPGDRRIRLVRRTERGDEVSAAVRRTFAEVEADWAEQVGPRRYATFRAVLAELGTGSEPAGPEAEA